MPAYLKIAGIKGESRAEGYKDEIDILSWSWGETQTGTFALGGAGTGKVQMQDVNFTMPYNSASPLLFLACASGEQIPSAVLRVTEAGEQPEEYLVVRLEPVRITSYQTGGTADSVPTDQFSMNFTQIKFEYKPEDETGRRGAAIVAGWDLSKAQKV